MRVFETIFVAECLPCFYDLEYQLDRPPERVPPLVELVSCFRRKLFALWASVYLILIS